MNKLIATMFSLMALLVVASPALAEQPETTDGFACPVIETEAVLNSPHGAAIGEGDFTILGPDVSVPVHATNGDGAGVPPDPHSEPGDTDYTAIWAI